MIFRRVSRPCGPPWIGAIGCCPPIQQTLFRLLGVFRGGATLPAVEQVASALGLPPAEVVGLLEMLVEHSLVVVRPGGSEDLRYHLLEPVAQYARSLLIGDEALRAVRAHARCSWT